MRDRPNENIPLAPVRGASKISASQILAAHDTRTTLPSRRLSKLNRIAKPPDAASLRLSFPFTFAPGSPMNAAASWGAFSHAAPRQ
jgi:hypothetical protein